MHKRVVAWVRARTIPTERPPLVGEVTQRMVRFQKFIQIFIFTLHGTTYAVCSVNCPSFSYATSSSPLVFTAGPRDRFPRWRCSKRKLSVCSVLRCPDLWLQSSVSFVHGSQKTHYTNTLYGQNTQFRNVNESGVGLPECFKVLNLLIVWSVATVVAMCYIQLALSIRRGDLYGCEYTYSTARFKLALVWIQLSDDEWYATSQCLLLHS
jgi:hypothetical protein